ncbi:MAG TPA: hypothetical protein VGU67_04525 [Edaphobacter sp.]|nr:hypothetical protein [Edaphobacter sp.]
MPNSFSSATGTPYVIQTIHQNGVNLQSYVVNNPPFYNPSAPSPPATLSAAGSSVPTVFTIDPHFHAALNMQGGVGVDRQVGKLITFNVTYLFTRGVHQYLSNTVTAPTFDVGTYTITGPTPKVYDNQFQSGGIFNQHQIIVTSTMRLRKLSLHSSYTYNQAKSDTGGVNFFPSVAHNPGLDYGRATFDIHHRLFLLATYNAPHGIIIAPLLAAQSGTPTTSPSVTTSPAITSSMLAPPTAPAERLMSSRRRMAASTPIPWAKENHWFPLASAQDPLMSSFTFVSVRLLASVHASKEQKAGWVVPKGAAVSTGVASVEARPRPNSTLPFLGNTISPLSWAL